MASFSSPETPPAASASAWETHSADYFGHTAALQASIAGLLTLAFITFVLMMQLPLSGLLMVGLFPLSLCAYLGFRLYLTFGSVEFFPAHVEIRTPGRNVAIKYDSIRQIRFDSFSHDLLVRDGKGEHRIARTIQGHRAILHRLHERVEVERDHSPEMAVTVRGLPKVACSICVAAMGLINAVVLVQMPLAGVGLLFVCIPAAYLFLDRCMLRSYRFTPSQLVVRGLRTRTYQRAGLQEAWISKSGFSSRFEMKFADGKVLFDEYLLSKALIQVSGYVERRWQQRVMPVSKRS